jgi:pyruvate/2-oxoglutarate dehydrogenase complex dihydrolipoamide acyltransferase (E2) component
MHGLLDVDVTEARRLLSTSEPPLSLTAFIVASVARAVGAHPQVHAYRDWRGRLVEHRHVDVQALIEVPTTPGFVRVGACRSRCRAADFLIETAITGLTSRTVWRPRAGFCSGRG